MTEARERRAVRRRTVTGRSIARVQGMRDVHLRDLSLTGAQIEHLDLLRLDARCELDLPPPFGALTLPTHVVWCTVIGRRHARTDGESRLVARSGLRFAPLTLAQRTALATTLQNLATAHQPIA
jgi:hypothetical protein